MWERNFFGVGPEGKEGKKKKKKKKKPKTSPRKRPLSLPDPHALLGLYLSFSSSQKKKKGGGKEQKIEEEEEEAVAGVSVP